MGNKGKVILRIFLYLLSFLIFLVGVYYFIENNILGYFISSFLTLSIYSFFIYKGYKILSPLSSVTFVVMSFIIFIMGCSAEGGVLGSSSNERAYLVSFALLLFFCLVVAILWYRTDTIWMKILASILVVFAIVFLFVFGFTLPTFYQNFVYTRIFIFIFFAFSVFLVMRKKIILRIVGILGIFVSIGCLLLSASFLTSKVYILEGQDKQEVIDFIDPKTKEMIADYNEGNLSKETFCKYCGFALLDTLYGEEEKLPIIRESYGKGELIDEPNVTRFSGSFYIEYPTKFEYYKDIHYVVFVLEGISSDSNIFGFYISTEPTKF